MVQQTPKRIGADQGERMERHQVVLLPQGYRWQMQGCMEATLSSCMLREIHTPSRTSKTKKKIRNAKAMRPVMSTINQRES